MTRLPVCMAQAARDELKEKKDKALQEKQQLEVTVCRLVSYMLEASPYSHHLHVTTQEELRQTRRSRDKLESDVAKAKSELSRLLRLEERMAQREEDLQVRGEACGGASGEVWR